jgi:hypothetical protein
MGGGDQREARGAFRHAIVSFDRVIRLGQLL